MRDRLGRELKIGDIIAFSYGNGKTEDHMRIGKILRFCKVMIEVAFSSPWNNCDIDKVRPENTLILSPDQVALIKEDKPWMAL